MRYMDGFKAFFKHEKWGMQLLLHSICMLIPILGFIVLFGHYLEVMIFQRDNGEETYPEFDFNRFSEYLSKGIWPFLAMLLLSLITIPLMLLVFAPLIAIPAMNMHGPEMAIPITATILLYIAFVVLLMLIQIPMLLQSGFTQTVGAAFSWTFIKGFLGRVMGAILLMHLFLIGISIPLILAGYITCGLGLYPAMAVLMFTQWQLYRQVYDLYLERGGPAIELNEKLMPPPAQST